MLLTPALSSFSSHWGWAVLCLDTALLMGFQPPLSNTVFFWYIQYFHDILIDAIYRDIFHDIFQVKIGSKISKISFLERLWQEFGIFFGKMPFLRNLLRQKSSTSRSQFGPNFKFRSRQLLISTKIDELHLVSGQFQGKNGQNHTLQVSLKYHDIFWILLWCNISKWCNILLSRYFTINIAHPCFQRAAAYLNLFVVLNFLKFNVFLLGSLHVLWLTACEWHSGEKMSP